MRTIDDYLDAAKANLGIKSDRQLSTHLGYKFTAVSDMRNKGAHPSDDMMLKLADAAKIDHESALIDLGYWRSSDAVREVYRSMAQRAGYAFVISLFISNAYTIAHSVQSHVLYIM